MTDVMRIVTRRARAKGQLEKVNTADLAMVDIMEGRDSHDRPDGHSEYEPDAAVVRALFRRMKKRLRAEIRELDSEFKQITDELVADVGTTPAVSPEEARAQMELGGEPEGEAA